MDLVKRIIPAIILLGLSAGCSHWHQPDMEAEEFPLFTGAVHIYKQEGELSKIDSVVVTTIGTTRHDDLTLHIDSFAFFEADSFSFSRKEYYALTGSHLYYYGNSASGYEKEPIPLIKFDLYEGKTWEDPRWEDNGNDSVEVQVPEWECVSYDTLWLAEGRYRAFCVEAPQMSGSQTTRYWYAPAVGLIKYYDGEALGTATSRELLAYYPTGIPDAATGGEE